MNIENFVRINEIFEYKILKGVKLNYLLNKYYNFIA